MKKFLAAFALLIVSASSFAYAPQKAVVCDYLAVVFEEKTEAVFVNVLLPTKTGLLDGFEAAQNVEIQKVEGVYTLDYPTPYGSVKLYIEKDSYTVVELFENVPIVEKRACHSSLNALFQ